MSAGRMHADEVDTDIDLVVRLLAAQFPQWAGLPMRPVPSAGTDNALYRLGDDMVVRLPRIDWAIGDVAKEQQWHAHGNAHANTNRSGDGYSNRYAKAGADGRVLHVLCDIRQRGRHHRPRDRPQPKWIDLGHGDLLQRTDPALAGWYADLGAARVAAVPRARRHRLDDQQQSVAVLPAGAVHAPVPGGCDAGECHLAAHDGPEPQQPGLRDQPARRTARVRAGKRVLRT